MCSQCVQSTLAAVCVSKEMLTDTRHFALSQFSFCQHCTRCKAIQGQPVDTHLFICCVQFPLSRRHTRCDAIQGSLSVPMCHGHMNCAVYSFPRASVAPGAAQYRSSLPIPTRHYAMSQFPPCRRCTRCNAVRGQPSGTHMLLCYVSVPPLPALHWV
jgi:hypothetical protein